MLKSRRLRDERGQASVFMALFVTTMILLFAFTTNIGMLVHAKINLQNAADAAAYAGAAVQARQLTAAAYLNWEMRRALKEFMFYYTVRSQYVSMPCFPLDASGRTLGSCQSRFGVTGPDERHNFAFQDPREANSETGGPFLPTTCIIFKEDNNYCQKAGVPGIPEFPAGGSWGVADPIVAAVRSATNDIINKKKTDCESRTDINRQFLIAWLFSLDPRPYFLTTGLDRADPFLEAEGLQRVGILPRMALLRTRIDNYEEMLNMNLINEGMGTVTDQTMGEFRAAKGGGKTLDYFERPIQAFLSARNNLPTIDNDNGNFAEVQLTELIPNESSVPEAERSPFVKNSPVLAKFDDLVGKVSFANSLFKERGSGGGDRGNCYQVRELRVIPRFPFGVTKDPRVPTYYAVRLQAKARLLFSPFAGNGVVTLSAYSAAKPFGSRVGKDLNPERSAEGARRMMVAPAYLGTDYGFTGYTDVPLSSSLAPTFPNPTITDPDAGSSLQGFTTQGHLGYLNAAAKSLTRADYGPRLAGAYAPWEVGFYTPPAVYDQGQEPVVGKFEDNPYFEGRWFALQGSVLPINGNANDLSAVRRRTEASLIGDLKDEATIGEKFGEFLRGVSGDPDSGVLSDGKFASLFNYLLMSKQVFFHYIPDPMLSDEPDLQAYARAAGPRYTVAGMNQPYKRQLTSWNNTKTSQDTSDASMGIEANSELANQMGRSGYSVRFISFPSLRAGGQASNDPDQPGYTWSNPFDRFNSGAGDINEAIERDLDKLRH